MFFPGKTSLPARSMYTLCPVSSAKLISDLTGKGLPFFVMPGSLTTSLLVGARFPAIFAVLIVLLIGAAYFHCSSSDFFFRRAAESLSPPSRSLSFNERLESVPFSPSSQSKRPFAFFFKSRISPPVVIFSVTLGVAGFFFMSQKKKYPSFLRPRLIGGRNRFPALDCSEGPLRPGARDGILLAITVPSCLQVRVKSRLFF